MDRIFMTLKKENWPKGYFDPALGIFTRFLEWESFSDCAFS